MATTKPYVIPRDVFLGCLGLVLGYTFGTIIDIVFFRIYKLLDPNLESLATLLLVISNQLFFVILFVLLFFNNTNIGSAGSIFFRLGITLSQVFMLGYAVDRISKSILARKQQVTTLGFKSTRYDNIPSQDMGYSDIVHSTLRID